MAAAARRSRAALRLVADVQAAPARPAMPVVVKLPEGFADEVTSIMAAARELERSTKLYATPEAVEVARRALGRLGVGALNALERLEGARP